MKRFIILSILLFAATAMASPFVVADPSSATNYRLRLSTDNGVTWSAWAVGSAVSGAMKFDLSTTTPGNYKAEVQSGGEATVTDSTTGQVTTVVLWSASSPFLLKLTPGQKTVNIKVIE